VKDKAISAAKKRTRTAIHGCWEGTEGPSTEKDEELSPGEASAKDHPGTMKMDAIRRPLRRPEGLPRTVVRK